MVCQVPREAARGHPPSRVGTSPEPLGPSSRPGCGDTRVAALAFSSPRDHGGPGLRMEPRPTDPAHAGLTPSTFHCEFQRARNTSGLGRLTSKRRINSAVTGWSCGRSSLPGAVSSLELPVQQVTPTLSRKNVTSGQLNFYLYTKLLVCFIYVFNAEMSLRCVRRQTEHDRPSSRLQLKAFHAHIGKRFAGINHSSLRAVHTHKLALCRLYNLRIKVP